MPTEDERVLEMLCTALEMKEKKQALYDDALKACPDQVGKETFRMLRDAEQEHAKQIQETHEALKKGKSWADACSFVLEPEGLKQAFRKIAEQYKDVTRACGDDVFAVETGMKLEDASVSYFSGQLKQAKDPLQRRFLEGLISDEREHFILLADLKFYYSDPQAWFMEKGKARLDGAGGVT
jgi:rubrerythrin